MARSLNSRTLRQAREARKLSRSEVSKHTKISERRLEQFETGDIEPSPIQLINLSKLYNTSLYSFYLDDNLLLTSLLRDFRKSQPTEANVSPAGLMKIWLVEHRSSFVSDLKEALGQSAPRTVSLARLTNSVTPEPAELRAGFDRWLETRDKTLKFQGAKEDVFQRQLRLFLEVSGCSTSFNDAPVDDYLGFYQKFSDNSRTIFINRSVKHEKRRLFTLAHEVGHLVYDAVGISNPFVARNTVERQCNAYAASFLSSDAEVTRIVRAATPAVLKDVSRLVGLLARETLLSSQAATLRLRDLEIISRKSAAEYFALLSNRRRISEPGGSNTKPAPKGRSVVVGKKLSEIGVLAAYTAYLALSKRLVDVVDIERGLGLTEGIQADVLALAARRYESSAA